MLINGRDTFHHVRLCARARVCVQWEYAQAGRRMLRESWLKVAMYTTRSPGPTMDWKRIIYARASDSGGTWRVCENWLLAGQGVCWWFAIGWGLWFAVSRLWWGFTRFLHGQGITGFIRTEVVCINNRGSIEWRVEAIIKLLWITIPKSRTVRLLNTDKTH